MILPIEIYVMKKCNGNYILDINEYFTHPVSWYDINPNIEDGVITLYLRRYILLVMSKKVHIDMVIC